LAEDLSEAWALEEDSLLTVTVLLASAEAPSLAVATDVSGFLASLTAGVAASGCFTSGEATTEAGSGDAAADTSVLLVCGATTAVAG